MRPHQREKFDEHFDTFTLLIDDIRPFKWFRSLPHKKIWHWYLAIGLLPPVFIALVLINWVESNSSPNMPLESPYKALSALGVWLICVSILNLVVFLSRVIVGKAKIVLALLLLVYSRNWLSGVMSAYSMSFASVIRYMWDGQVYCYPNIYSNGKPPFWIWEPKALEHLNPVIIAGYSILGEVAFLLMIAAQIISSLILATLGMIVVTALIRFVRALAWRIAEFKTGAFMGVMALGGFVLGGLRVILS